MQDGVPPRIATPVKQLLNLHFGNYQSPFLNSLAPRSLDLNRCDFWLWGYLAVVVYGVLIANLAELKNRITQHIHNITTETLRSVVEHAILRFQLIGENGGEHIEHCYSKSKPTSFS
ncbi:hypothetical protein AVEN_220976-1 [Araneus ventricosus]|uniref:Uncharacterized protein n=1 Tax=Araneus ventricosus TaxID=182803 RepID=A0A4Y2FME7_ARAVE|nr:hypothetical protein AVEN_60704-1 [Araneus ventricosus]GBM41736.1 hypothetical protein AVEN_137641-1 [Araneus ventricosus]GBM43659.1 hypothetical protein AVEN_220976-1 [Araneus ventricosus]